MQNLKNFFVLLFVLIGGYFSSYSQGRVITGKILDHEGVPLVGASVVIKGALSGTTSDVVGKYSIYSPNTSVVLVVSYTGCTTKEETVTTTQKDITLDCSLATPEQKAEILRKRKIYNNKKQK
jgi:hypothetical protein